MIALSGLELVSILGANALWLLPAVGLCAPAARRKVAFLTLGLGGLLLVLGLLGTGASPGPDGTPVRTLQVTSTFAAYAEDGFEITPRDFPIETVTAAPWSWTLPMVGVAVLAAVLMLGLGTRLPGPWLLPVALGWCALAALLGAQKLAGPAAAVQPYGVDRVLFPMSLAMGVLAARQCDRLAPMFFQLVVCLFAMRLPVALFSKLASDLHWGTSLDIHTITAFVNPLADHEVETEAGSAQQQAWLIWAQHLGFVPAFYLMSVGGVAFVVHTYRVHGPKTA